jgi:hypothetical protein
MLYEIGDPAAYVLPDVVCDFTAVRIEQAGENRVRVSGARGRPPTSTYKVSATHADGWRVIATVMIAGRDAAAKARREGEAIIERTRRLLHAAGLPDYLETSIEIIGAEDTYGPRRQPALTAREVVLKLGLRHASKDGLDLFAREMTQAAVAMAQGTTGLFGGRPSPSPVVRLFSFLLDKSQVPSRVSVGERDFDVPIAAGETFVPVPQQVVPPEPAPADVVEVPLVALAWTRSGDKGNHANIGVIARRPEFASALRRELTPERIGSCFSHYLKGPVTRWELPGVHAFNFLLEDVLGGGGIASLRYDPQGKTYGQMLLDLPVRVPRAWVEAGGPLAAQASKEC